MNIGMIVFIVIFCSILFVVLLAYYVGVIGIDERQEDAETKKQYLKGLIPGYWWYIDFLKWKERFLENWRELK